MIARNTPIAAYVSGTAGGWLTNANEARAAIIAALGQHFVVDALTWRTNEGATSITFTYTAQVRVRPLADYAEVADVLSIIKGDFWDTTDYEPVVSQTAQQDPEKPSGFFDLDPSTVFVLAIVGAVLIFAIIKVR